MSIRSFKDGGCLIRDCCRFMLYRISGVRPLLKDPIAFFSAEWLAETFDMRVVVFVRHPAAFVSSLKELKSFHPFSDFLEQPLLMKRFLSPFKSEIRRCAAHERDILDQAVLLWKIIYHTAILYHRRHPEWIFVRHEDLSADPVVSFRVLFNQLGLEFDARVERIVRKYTEVPNRTDVSPASIRRNSRMNLSNWRRRLTNEEIEKIRRDVEPISKEFYGDDEW